MAKGEAEECLLAYRTKREYWGKERAVIVTYNPSSRRKSEIPPHPIFFTRIYLPSGLAMEITGMVFSSVVRNPS